MDEDLDDLDLQQHVDAVLAKLGLDDEMVVTATDHRGKKLRDADNERHGRTKETECGLERDYETALGQDPLAGLDGDEEGTSRTHAAGLAEAGLGEGLARAIAKLDARYTRIISMLQHELEQCKRQKERVVTAALPEEDRTH